MKKILIVVLVLLLMFALIRITTSTYENIKRKHTAGICYWKNTETFISVHN